MGDDPIREFGPTTRSFTEDNLATARRTLTKAQSMDWFADGEPITPNGHKVPCFPVNNVEWLFGYIDSLRATLAAERAEGERRLTETARFLALVGYGLTWADREHQLPEWLRRPLAEAWVDVTAGAGTDDVDDFYGDLAEELGWDAALAPPPSPTEEA